MSETTNGQNGRLRLSFDPSISLGSIVTVLSVVASVAYLNATFAADVRDLSIDVCELRGIVGGMKPIDASFQCRGPNRRSVGP